MFRAFVGFIVFVALVCGAVFVIAGRGTPPQIAIVKPDRVIGQSGTLEVTAEAPKARFTALSIALEQNGKTTALYTLANAQNVPWGYFAAGGMVIVLPTLFVFLILQRFLVSGLTIGGVKG